jgi:site-specific DNA recombinase
MAAPAPAKPKRARKRRRTTPGFGDLPTGPRRVAIYLRRSTDDEHQPFSINVQDSALGKYVTTQPGWTLVATYTDDASGATTKRPGLQQALRAARAGRFDVLLVYRVDRFTRRLSDLLDLLNELDEAGVAFASATEPFDTSTSIGRMLVQLLGVFAEFERETIIDRVTKGMAMKASKGKWPGGSRPYGFHVDQETHTLVPYPQEAPHLREIFRLFVEERLGTRAIADQLNRRGVSNRTGKPWSGHTINRIIANPAYAGDLAYGDVYVENAHDPLISRETWRKACEIAASRAGACTQRAMSGSGYHLTGLITCPACGHKFIGTAATGRNRVYRYYTCFSRSRYGTHGCQAQRLPADALDTAILDSLATFYTSHTDLIADAVTRAQQRHRDGHAGRRAEHAALLAQIQQKQTAIERYFTAFENGNHDRRNRRATPPDPARRDHPAHRPRRGTSRRHRHRTCPTTRWPHEAAPDLPGRRHDWRDSRRAQSRHRSLRRRDPPHRRRSHPCLPHPRAAHTHPRHRRPRRRRRSHANRRTGSRNGTVGEVFTFGRDLCKGGLAGGLPTG